jgi:molybdopterin-containing oxidoreductase family membrane subunit
MYAPSIWDWSLYVGTLGFFFTLVFLFVRFLPVISIFEVRTLLPAANVHGHQQDFEENVVEIEYTYERTDPPNR